MVISRRVEGNAASHPSVWMGVLRKSIVCSEVQYVNHPGVYSIGGLCIVTKSVHRFISFLLHGAVSLNVGNLLIMGISRDDARERFISF